MAASTYDEALRRLLLHEGGYCNHPQDTGGPTNFGITIADYRKYIKPGASADDVRAMRLEEAKAIYRSKYWRALRCDELPAGVDDTIFDYGVNSGVARAGKVLRRVLGMPDDTWGVSDDVIAEVARRDPRAVIAAINAERLAFLRGLRSWPVFGTGWERRVGDVREFSIHIAGQALTGTEPPVTVGAIGKGAIPQPRLMKAAITQGVPAAAAMTAFGFMDWVSAHPWASIGIAAVGLCAVGAAFHRLDQWHRTQQEAPTPGLVPITPCMQENQK